MMINSPRLDAVIVGAGLAGLTAGWEFQRHGRSFVILEKNARPGGMIQSEQIQGYLLEKGPNTVQNSETIAELIGELGLTSQLLIAPTRIPRYVHYRGKLHAVPMSPVSLLTTDLISLHGKYQLLREPWNGSEPTSPDESLRDFSDRRFGHEVTQRLLAPFVSGVWAGDIDKLSAAASFPKLVAWEREQGSVVRGAFKSKRSREHKGLIGFQDGWSVFIKALAESLKPSLRLSLAATSITPTNDGWSVTTEEETFFSKALILALPAYASVQLVRFNPQLAEALEAIAYTAVDVVHMGFPPKAVSKKQTGFGFLTVPQEKQDILGCLWNSDIFPGRAPQGHSLFTVFIGGAQRPDLADRPDEQILQMTRDSLKNVMEITKEPDLTMVTRQQKAIPQYNQGYLARINAIETAERTHPGLAVIGNIRGGIAVSDVVASSRRRAKELLNRF